MTRIRHLRSSCPALCRASTPCLATKKGVDDAGQSPAMTWRVVAVTVRAAIIGLGRWGRLLVNAAHGKTDAIRLTAAYTRTAARQRGRLLVVTRAFRSWTATIQILLKSGASTRWCWRRCTACTPEQAAAAATAGKHIHVEKLLTLDWLRALRSVRWRRQSAPASCWRVGFNRRFHPSAVVEIRKRLADGQPWPGRNRWSRSTPTSTGQFIAADNWRAQPDEAPGGAADRGRRAFDRPL